MMTRELEVSDTSIVASCKRKHTSVGNESVSDRAKDIPLLAKLNLTHNYYLLFRNGLQKITEKMN